ncbi:MAG: hypothetical protein HOC74_32915 [Gemmatimonadetes bacterium]|nr:hypothetical protein [Gemmatimonadota bacterium]
MDWQTISAIGISLLCGAWVLYRWLRPFFDKETTGCNACESCGTQKGQGELLQITSQDELTLN